MVRQLSQVGSVADDFFRSWINARELRLADRDNTQVCSFDWGTEALKAVPGFDSPTGSPEVEIFRQANQSWLRNSAAFFAYQKPREFQLRGPHLQFVSAVESVYRENDTVFADYFQCSRARGRAVLVLPHWNALPSSYAGFCRFLNWLGFSALLVTLPYHGNRKPRQCTGAEYSVSPNIGRTIACVRQGVVDTLCCLDWLTQMGYDRFGIAGSSLGICGQRARPPPHRKCF
jgi:hypothetical protein